MTAPLHCRPEAFELFAAGLSNLENTTGLVDAAIALSLHALDDVSCQNVHRHLDALAGRVGRRARPDQPQAVLAHLHRVLFDEEGFRGERTNYYIAANSYLPYVLHSRRGIPITLSLVYKAVAERVGLEVEGINAPGHFLVRVRDTSGWLLIDPYYGGVVRTEEETYVLIDRVFNQAVPRTFDLHRPATHTQWLERLLLNLQTNFARSGNHEDLAAMTELQQLLRERQAVKAA